MTTDRASRLGRRALAATASTFVALALFTGGAPEAEAQAVPCIPSPSTPPTVGNQCEPVEPSVPVRAADSVEEVTLPMEAPLSARWGEAGYSVATFSVPRSRAGGVIRIGSFIAARELPRGLILGYGNDRTFDPNFDARRTKVTIELNLTTGEGTVWADPSCARLRKKVVPWVEIGKTVCHAAIPLDASDDGSQLLVGSRQGADGATDIRVRYSAKQSLFEDVPVLRSAFPRISGDLTVTFDQSGAVCLSGRVDPFPSVEAYLYRPHGGAVETLFRHKEVRWGPEVGLSGVLAQKKVLACTD